MKYEDMSNSQINARVTMELFGLYGWELSENDGDCSFYHCGVDGNGYYEQAVLDFCNSPSDAWGVIVDNGIGICKYNLDEDDASFGMWFALCDEIDDIDEYPQDKNPLRAAMICFLKMKDAE